MRLLLVMVLATSSCTFWQQETEFDKATRLSKEHKYEEAIIILDRLVKANREGPDALAAARLGAGRVVGVDIDPQALRASEANAASNDVTAEFVDAGALAAGRFDVVVANILANPIIVLAPALATRVAAHGRIALSGILEAQTDTVVAAYAPWFTLAAERADEGWVLLTATAP